MEYVLTGLNGALAESHTSLRSAKDAARRRASNPLKWTCEVANGVRVYSADDDFDIHVCGLDAYLAERARRKAFARRE